MSSISWPDFNDLWDYGDPAGSEAAFRALLPAAPQSAESSSYHLQLLTQIARALGLQKKFDEAHALLDEVEGRMAGGDVVEVRYLLERGRVFNSAKQPARAVPLFKRAASVSEQIGADFYRVDALHMLGIAAPIDQSLDWNLRAIRTAEQASDPHAKKWMGSLYNNTGWSLFDAGRYPEALELFQKAQAYREAHGDPDDIAIARWCVAKTLRVMGRVDEALAIQRDLEETTDPDGFIEEEIAECLYALGQVEQAKPYFAAALAALSAIDWVAEDEERIDRLKALSG